MCALSLLLVLSCALTVINTQATATENVASQEQVKLQKEVTLRLGDIFVLVLRYLKVNNQNPVISPTNVFVILSAISEAATGITVEEISNVLWISIPDRSEIRHIAENICNLLQNNTSAHTSENVNAIFINSQAVPRERYKAILDLFYKVKIVPLNSNVTQEQIPKLEDNQLILASSFNFKGHWTWPFNLTQTFIANFYDSDGQKTGEVAMMHSIFTYPFANINELQARILELPYGIDGSLSMLIILPDNRIGLEKVLSNFQKISIPAIFGELRLSQEENENLKIDCYIPKFKIQSNLDLTDALQSLGIRQMFTETASLPGLARANHFSPKRVSKVMHNVQIEVTEKGIDTSAVTAAESSIEGNSETLFYVNKPFIYLIVEKVTNSLVLGGLYESPT